VVVDGGAVVVVEGRRRGRGGQTGVDASARGKGREGGETEAEVEQKEKKR
jgi:hypothetical protein